MTPVRRSLLSVVNSLVRLRETKIEQININISGHMTINVSPSES